MNKINKVIIIEHDGHRFITSENQIQSQEDLIGMYITCIGGVLRNIMRGSLYGQIIVDEYNSGNYSKV